MSKRLTLTKVSCFGRFARRLEKIRILTWFLGDLLCVILLPTSKAQGADGGLNVERLIFVADLAQPQVHAVDTNTNELARVYELPYAAEQMVISAQRNLIITANTSSEILTLTDIATGKKTSLALGVTPNQIQLDPSGELLGISAFPDDRILTLDVAAGQILVDIPVRSPHNVVFHPTELRLYVAALTSDRVMTIDPRTGSQLQRIPVGPPKGALGVDNLVLSLDGRLGLATPALGRYVSLVDLDSSKTVATKAVGEEPGLSAMTFLGDQILVSDRSTGALEVLDTDGLRSKISFEVGLDVSGLVTGLLGSRAAVLVRSTRHVAVIDLDRHMVLAEIGLPGEPVSGVLGPRGRKLYVSAEDEAGLVVIDLQSARMEKVIDMLEGQPGLLMAAGSLSFCH